MTLFIRTCVFFIFACNIFFKTNNVYANNELTVSPETFLPTKVDLIKSIKAYYNSLLKLYYREKNKNALNALLKLASFLGLDLISNGIPLSSSPKLFVSDLDKAYKVLNKVEHILMNKLCEDIAHLEKTYDDLLSLISLHNEKVNSFCNVEIIKKIKDEQYRNMKISPLDYYSFLEDYNKKEMILKESLNKLSLLRNELILESKRNYKLIKI